MNWLLALGALHDQTWAPWVATLYSTASILSLMVPGFVAGLVAGRRGILIGASAAALLALCSFLPEIVMMLKTSGLSLGDAPRMLLAFVMRFPASIVASALAGGCAELLRSTKSPTRAPLSSIARAQMLARYQTSIALAAGVAAGWAMNWLVLDVIPKLAQGAMHGETSAPWIATLYSTAFVSRLMVPGFVAGLVAGRKGILIGASAAALLALFSLLPDVVIMLKSSELSWGDAPRKLLAVFMRYPAGILSSAVAGGCAELLRSKKAPERTRER